MPITLAQEQTATLELNGGSTRAAVHFAVLEDHGEERGYLRLAFGQGNLVNRLLNSVGKAGRLLTDDGTCYHIRITSSEPSRVPGNLCAFDLADV